MKIFERKGERGIAPFWADSLRTSMPVRGIAHSSVLGQRMLRLVLVGERYEGLPFLFITL
jgi:hypothetical protein